jgi:hypothetical protein
VRASEKSDEVALQLKRLAAALSTMTFATVPVTPSSPATSHRLLHLIEAIMVVMSDDVSLEVEMGLPCQSPRWQQH